MYRIKEGFYIGTGKEMLRIIRSMRNRNIDVATCDNVTTCEVAGLFSSSKGWYVQTGLPVVNYAFLLSSSNMQKSIINTLVCVEYEGRWGLKHNLLYPTTPEGVNFLNSIDLPKWVEFKKKALKKA